MTFARRLPSHAYLVILLSGPGGEAALTDAVVHGNAATTTVDPLCPLKPGIYTLRVIATSDARGAVYYQGTYTVRATPSAGGMLTATCGSLHATAFTGWFPKIVGICPAPGSRISNTTTFTVTFTAVLPADTQVQMHLFRADRSGNLTGGEAQLIDQLVKGNRVTVKVAPSPSLQPGTYELVVAPGSVSSGLAEYRGTYTVR